MPPGMLVHLKSNERPRDIGPRKLRGLQPLHFFFPRSSLRRTRARRKTRDELIQLRDFAFALGVFRFDARPNRSLREHHVVVPAVVHDHGLVVDVGGMRADAVQKMAVVRNHDQHAFVFAQIILQPVNRIQDPSGSSARPAATPADCRKALAPAARELFARPAIRSSCARAAALPSRVHRAAPPHRPPPCSRLPRRRSPPARQPHAVLIGSDSCGFAYSASRSSSAFHSGAVAHDHRIDHAKLVERELILAQNAELLRPPDRALCRLDFAGREFSSMWICPRHSAR